MKLKGNISTIIDDDAWLEPYREVINHRISHFYHHADTIFQSDAFSSQHETLGIHYHPEKDIWIYREWAPEAYQLSLVGDFNNWNKESHPLRKGKNGIWSIEISKKETLPEGSLVKVHVQSQKGNHDRIPAYIRRVVQNEETKDFAGQIIYPTDFSWSNFTPTKEAPVVYEAHIGMAQEKEGVGSYTEFRQKTLPKIKKNGYNTIQLMAIQEHPYYGSFGYHVSNFFAPTSRFGTPQELKELIDAAHQLGIRVIIDLVHSHAVKNIAEGLNEFDGTDHQYFHGGGKGDHPSWDSKLFNYSKKEVLQFLLSNIRYWMEEFNVDGFRFDGITSMLYVHHGDYTQFDHYDKYFNEDVDQDAFLYLQLANYLTHQIKPEAITIAEDFSGMPGMCRPQEIGGVGFDYRLGMGIPDYWIKLLKEKRDEDWSVGEIYHTLINRRWKEKTVAYCESHDQAIVGDKSIAFWLMDKEMYYHMQVDDHHPIIDRGIALHKIIRLLTLSLGGEAYLNFIGNEFGHPEWVDFPREGNDWSYQYARRQWSLAENPELKYKYLYQFDADMIQLAKQYGTLDFQETHLLNIDEENKVIVFQKGELVFVFNLSTQKSIMDYQFHVPTNGKYKIVLSSDAPVYGGFDRIEMDMIHESTENKLSIYCINRAVLVFKLL